MKIKVMLIEDNPADQKIVGRCLREEEYNLEIAGSLKEATDSLFPLPNIILMDLNLPDSRGLSTYLQMRQYAPHLPIIIMSGTADQALAMEAIANGAQDFIVKGKYDPRHLNRTIRYALLRHDVEKLKLEQERMKERENFSAMLTHNLRVPLIGMENVLRPLIGGAMGELSEDVRGAMETLLSATTSTHAHIKRALEAYQLQNQEDDTTDTTIDLNQVLERCIAEIELAYKEKKLEIQHRKSGNMQPFKGNEYSIYTLFLNLLDNAAKFSPVSSTISIYVSQLSESSITAIIKNYGRDIPESKLEKLFDYFYPTNTKEQGVNAGVGLYLCKRVVENHEGTIEITSEKGTTTVVVELPTDRS